MSVMALDRAYTKKFPFEVLCGNLAHLISLSRKLGGYTYINEL